METSKYKTTDVRWIKGIRYEKDAEVYLTDREARNLLRAGKIVKPAASRNKKNDNPATPEGGEK